MLNNIFMSNSYFLVLAKNGRLLHDIPTLFSFLTLWSQYISIYTNKILLYLQKNYFFFNASFDFTIV